MLHRLCERREFASGGSGEALTPEDRVVCTQWDDGLMSGVARCGRCGSCWLLTWVLYDEKNASRPRYVAAPVDSATFDALVTAMPEGEQSKPVSYWRPIHGPYEAVDEELARSCRAMPGEILVTLGDGWSRIYRVRAPWSRRPRLPDTLASMVTRPLLRAGFFLVWAGYMAWMAIDMSRWFLRWPMALFALVALGLAVHFARVARRQRAG